MRVLNFSGRGCFLDLTEKFFITDEYANVQQLQRGELNNNQILGVKE